MASNVERLIVPYAIGLAPPVMVALTWAPTGELSANELLFRSFYVAVIGAELFAILVALREGLMASIARWAWPRPVVAAALSLLVIAVGTVFTAPVPGAALKLTLFWLIHALFALSIAHLCGRLFEPKHLIRAYLVGFALFAGEFLLFVSLVPDWSQFDWQRRFMMFTHVRHAGYYLAAIAALAIGVMAGPTTRREWLAGLSAACAAIGIAMWTGSRGAMLAVAAAVLAGLLFAPAMRTARAWGGALASMGIALALVAVAPSVQNRLMGLERTITATAQPDITTGRTAIWANATGAIQRRSLFGYGEGQMHAVAPYSIMVQPHNVLLQIALAWGLLGLACVLVLSLAFMVRTLPTIRRDQGTLTPAFLAMTTLATLSLYDGALYYALPISIFMALGGSLASGWRPVTGGGPEPLAAGDPAPAGTAQG